MPDELLARAKESALVSAEFDSDQKEKKKKIFKIVLFLVM